MRPAELTEVPGRRLRITLPEGISGSCAMNKGFYLTLMMGSFNASPVPQRRHRRADRRAGDVDCRQPGRLPAEIHDRPQCRRSPQLQASGFFDPRQRVIIAVTVNGTTEVLMDGIITKQDLTPSSAAGKSTLTITGLDLTALMDFIDLTGIPYPAMPLFVIVELILAKYAVLGVMPVAIPPIMSLIRKSARAFPSSSRAPTTRYVTALAGTVGGVFYLDPGPQPGMSMAYWGPDLTKMFGGTQPALSINLDASTNVDSLSFSYDGTLATQLPGHHHRAELEDPDSRSRSRTSTCFKPRLGAHAPTPLKYTQLTPESRAKTRSRRRSRRSASCSTPPTSSPPAASSTCCATAASSRRASWSACAAPASLRRPVLRQERHPQHQARRIQAELHAGARRHSISIGADGERMSDGTSKYYGNYRGTVVNNIDPMQIGPHHGDGARRAAA